jgi:hypothetical protein
VNGFMFFLGAGVAAWGAFGLIRPQQLERFCQGYSRLNRKIFTLGKFREWDPQAEIDFFHPIIKPICVVFVLIGTVFIVASFTSN